MDLGLEGGGFVILGEKGLRVGAVRLAGAEAGGHREVCHGGRCKGEEGNI